MSFPFFDYSFLTAVTCTGRVRERATIFAVLSGFHAATEPQATGHATAEISFMPLPDIAAMPYSAYFRSLRLYARYAAQTRLRTPAAACQALPPPPLCRRLPAAAFSRPPAIRLLSPYYFTAYELLISMPLLRVFALITFAVISPAAATP